jgi:hypothetical protein
MTNPTLERAARAAEKAYECDSGSVGEPVDWKVVARAVLSAVRKPEAWVEEAGLPWTGKILPGAAFTAMIDAIIADGGE